MFYKKRHLRICYLIQDKNVVDSRRAYLEKQLKSFVSFDLVEIQSLEDPNLKPCDLLVVDAHRLDEETFMTWFRSFSKRIMKQGFIWIPALVVAEISMETFSEAFDEFLQMNWYFDIVSPDHFASMPLRMTNLLRIHDHLHELDRYRQMIDKLTQRVDKLSHKTQ